MTHGRYVILCGGRDHPIFTNQERAWLDTLHVQMPFAELIIGGASGADEEGRNWARSAGIDCVTMWPNWTRDGNAAGPQRNQRMLEYVLMKNYEAREIPPPLVIAFPGGRGTADMVFRAKRSGVYVLYREQLSRGKDHAPTPR